MPYTQKFGYSRPTGSADLQGFGDRRLDLLRARGASNCHIDAALIKHRPDSCAPARYPHAPACGNNGLRKSPEVNPAALHSTYP